MSRAGALAGRLSLIVLLALAIPSRVLNLDAFAGKFDEGIRGTQLMLMAAGYRPFRDIFASQGPLSLDIFYPTYMLFGQTLGGQSVESNESQFPVNVCNGCLVYFPPAADDPARPGVDCAAAGEDVPVPCVFGQDEAIDCRLCNELPICNPAVP